MTLHITNLDKHRYVCGLFWQSLSKPRELEREAIDLGRKIDADLMVVRMDHTTAQAGFAQTRDGARRGMYSLAAVVSRTMASEGAFYDGEQQPVHNWLGAFRLPDGQWVYFAVRDANFLPNGDFAGSKEEVLERLQSDYALGGWNVVVGDEELRAFGFHNFQVREVRSFIPQRADGSLRVQRRAALRRVGGRLSRMHLVAAGVAALAVAGGYAWMLYQRDVAERERELAMQQVRERILREAPPWPGPGTSVPCRRPWCAPACRSSAIRPRAAGNWSPIPARSSNRPMPGGAATPPSPCCASGCPRSRWIHPASARATCARCNCRPDPPRTCWIAAAPWNRCCRTCR